MKHVACSYAGAGVCHQIRSLDGTAALTSCPVHRVEEGAFVIFQGPEKYVMQVDAALRQAEIVRCLSSNPAQQTEAPGRDPSALLHRLQLGQANAPLSAGQQVGYVVCIWHLHAPIPVSRLSWGHISRKVAQSFQQCRDCGECLRTKSGCSNIWPESSLGSLYSVPPRHAKEHCRCTRGL